MRKQLRRLEREVGPVRFAFDARDPEAFRALLRWKSSQYRRTGRVNRVAVEWVEHLLWDLFDRGSCSAGILSVLYAGERMIAGHFGMQTESYLSYWFPAYDPLFARYSPGLGLLLRIAHAAAANRIDCVDLGKGDESYKQSLGNGELIVGEGLIRRPSLAAAVHTVRRAPQQFTYNLIMSHPPLRRAVRGALRGVGRVRSPT
jgi:CelD/BcsL family acetyltransferase involved in cellulose biosynthesis